MPCRSTRFAAPALHPNALYLGRSMHYIYFFFTKTCQPHQINAVSIPGSLCQKKCSNAIADATRSQDLCEAFDNTLTGNYPQLPFALMYTQSLCGE